MSYEASKKQAGRKPLTVIECDFDSCGRSFGVSPCTASGAPGTECYNTFATCQDAPNYLKTIKTVRFFEQFANLPAGVEGFPCLDGAPSLAPTKILPDKGLGYRGAVSVSLKDFPHHDRGLDPYVSTRNYKADKQGTFFGKLLSRNPFYQGRAMRVRTGFINTPFSWSDFEDRTYVIEKIDVLDNTGKVKISAKDLLKLADDKRAQAPAPSEGTLAADITAGAGSLSLVAGKGAAYPTAGTYRIGDEIGTYTRAGDVVTLTSRNEWGTTAVEHKAGDLFQDCLVYNAANVVDIIHGLLTDYASIDETNIPYDAGLGTPTGTADEWDLEKADWLSANDLSMVVSKPTGIMKLLQEITEQNLCYIWWDEVSAKIKLKAIAPTLKNEIPPALNDTSHVIEKSISVMDSPDDRITELWVYYDKIDHSDDNKAENFRALKIQIDTDAESVNAYGDKRVKTIYANWLSATNAGLVTTLAGRLLNRYSATPKKIKFSLDAKDTVIWTGSSATLTTNKIQGIDGAALVQKLQVLQVKETKPGHRYDYEAISFDYGFDRYAFIAPNTMGNYTVESEANQTAYGFISQNNGQYTNGDAGHLIA